MRLLTIFIALTGFVAAGTSLAQQATPSVKIPTVGILTPAENDRTAVFEAFRQGLRDNGYIEGRNIILEFRLARGDYGALPRLAAELVDLPVDVIVTDGDTTVAHAAISATRIIPIVMGTSADPVAQGYVASLARPGGNVTGFSLLTNELSIKRLQLLRTAFPTATTVSVLLNPLNQGSEVDFRSLIDAAPSLNLKLMRLDAGTPEALRGLRPNLITGPVLVLPDAMFWNRRADILALIAASRAPALYPEREYADDGGLIAYGPSVPDNFRRAAGYVDRILKGANPGELPVQQPAKFELVINLKTARSLGIDVPSPLFTQADEVIE